MYVKVSHLAILGLFLAACGQDEQLLLPDNIEVHWDSSFNALDDSLGAVVPVDVMVYDSTSGEPLSDVELEFHVDTQHAHLLRTSALAPMVWRCDDCDSLWDSYSDQYYEVNVELDVTHPRLRINTDEDGLAQFYVVVDSFAANNGSFLSVEVEAETDAVRGSFYLQPR